MPGMIVADAPALLLLKFECAVCAGQKSMPDKDGEERMLSLSMVIKYAKLKFLGIHAASQATTF